MFDTLLTADGSRTRRMRKGLTFSLSLILHATVIVAVIVVPLLHAEAKLPGYKIIGVSLIAPPIIPGPPPGPGRPPKGGPVTGPLKGGSPNPPPVNGPPVFRAPVEIPTAIIDEDPTEFALEESTGPGVDGGVGDGKTPWIIAPEILPEEIKPFDAAVATIRPPRLIKSVSPAYPIYAINARISGLVMIEAATDIYGRVQEAHVISGHALLNGAALEAVKKWIYEPYLINGIPKPVRFKVTVTFSLETH